jgi:serine/threonine-protein kinase
LELQPGEQIGDYKVVSRLGSGGTASVYVCKHRRLQTRHAIKVLSVAGAGIAERLLQEGRVQAQLHHPNIVRVLDVLEVNHSPALVMEYVEGPTLEQLLKAYDPTMSEGLEVFRAVVAGVDYAHRNGLVHRDLKPANVLMQIDEQGLVARVTDFGLAKATEAGNRLTRTGALMGTPAFMAPEQFQDAASVDRRADLYSLGCMLYELVCGKPPFSMHTHPKDVLEAKKGRKYISPIEHDPTLPASVVRTIEALLEPDRDNRPATCGEVMALLDGANPLEPVLAPPPPPTNSTIGRVADTLAMHRRASAPTPPTAQPRDLEHRLDRANLAALIADDSPGPKTVGEIAIDDKGALDTMSPAEDFRPGGSPRRGPPWTPVLFGVGIVGVLAVGLAWWAVGLPPFGAAPVVADPTDPVVTQVGDEPPIADEGSAAGTTRPAAGAASSGTTSNAGDGAAITAGTTPSGTPTRAATTTPSGTPTKAATTTPSGTPANVATTPPSGTPTKAATTTPSGTPTDDGPTDDGPTDDGGSERPTRITIDPVPDDPSDDPVDGASDPAPPMPPDPTPAGGGDPAQIVVLGSVATVELHAPGRNLTSSSPIPPGDYIVWVRWTEGAELTPAGRVTIQAGETVALSCRASEKRCSR